MSTFFISDTHFGDERILRYESRPFETVQQMDDALIENWNRVVGDTDTVFHLGDVSAYDFQKTQQILSALNGKKIKDVSRQSACVCVERIDYTPIEWETLRQKMLQLP